MKQDRKFTVVVEGDEEGLLCRDRTHSAEMLHSGNPSTSDTRMRRVRKLSRFAWLVMAIEAAR